MDMNDVLKTRLSFLEKKEDERYGYVSESSAMESVNRKITELRRRALTADQPEPSVLILGEIGTEKEPLARMVYNGSRRAKSPWLVFDCSDSQAENRLAKVIQQSVGSTLYLEKVEKLSSNLQTRLLSELMNKGRDIRWIATGDVSLTAAVERGSFKKEVYDLLAQEKIDVPSLRQRKDELTAVASFFARRAFQKYDKDFAGFSPDAEMAVRNHSWPGNVEELICTMEKVALIVSGQNRITADDLGLDTQGQASVHSINRGPLKLVSGEPATNGFDHAEAELSYTELKKKWSDSFERQFLTDVLVKCHGNVSAAAREAKLDRSNFLRLLRRHKIRSDEFRKVQKVA